LAPVLHRTASVGTAFLALLVLAMAVAGCDTAQEGADFAYATPTLLTPDRTEQFTSEEIQFAWDLPEAATGTEFTVLWLDDFYTPSRHQAAFDTTGVNDGYSGGTEPQQVYTLTFGGSGPAQDQYLAYRVRATGPNGVSAWTEIRTLHIRPLSDLERLAIDMTLPLAFEATESGLYHSGVMTSAPIDFAASVAARGYDLASVRVVKAAAGRFEYADAASDGYRDFERLVIGLVENDDVASDYPGDVLADAYGFAVEGVSPLTFYPFGGRYRNLSAALAAAPRVRLAYFLDDDATVGTAHEIALTLELDVYVE
ncbi:MAG: hypothetical protein AAFN13_17280, partial [Bacteroidota bacterium]